MPSLTRDFFISRAGQDAPWAKWIARVLREEKFTTFLQDEDFLPGRSFVSYMDEGARLERTLALLSPDYFVSPFTSIEWQSALAQGRLMTVLVRPCEIPPLLSHIVYINLVGADEAEARARLLNGVRGLPTSGPSPFPGAPVEFPGPHYVSVAKLPQVNPLMVGREAELKQIDAAWADPKTHIVSIVAFGGVGKTSLAINWWHRNQAPGAKRILGWSFYSQGAKEDSQATGETFLDYALREWFGVTNPPTDSWARGEKLAELIRREKTLLILDGLEPIQFPPGEQSGHFKDPGMVALLRELDAHNPELCICTSRLPLTDLDNAATVVIDLDNLGDAGGEYLKQLGVKGPDEELRKASEEFDHHALALTLLGNFLVKRRGGDVYQRDTLPALFEEPKKGGHARRVLRQYETLFKGKPELDVLRMVGLFDRPADKGAVKLLRKLFRKLAADAWAGALENLKEARLIEYEDLDGPLDCHPLIREHFAEEYRASNPEKFRAAHAQLYEHYSKLAPHRPDTVEAMTPLFYAVYHGCQAGKHEEALDAVYRDRILRGKEFFLWKKLGAFGVDLSLVANFFVTPWSEPVPALSAAAQSFVMNSTSFALRSLGRLGEAVELMQSGTEVCLKLADWKRAAVILSNLSEVYLTLGNIGESIAAARRSVEFADKSRDEFWCMASRATLSGPLHQSGNFNGAARLFAEAEKRQAALQINDTILFSLRGYHYCDLLLAQGQTSDVLFRATQTIEIAHDNGWIAAIALDHLSLGRAHPPGSAEAAQDLDQAVSGLRRAGQLDDLPRGLLARAAHFRHTRQFEKAQHDLDEVRVLATRCGMRLHLADYHLEQARLFLAQQIPPTPARTTNPPQSSSKKPAITAATPSYASCTPTFY